jgi:hypothetical protein
MKTQFPFRMLFPLLLAGATGTATAADATVTVTAETPVASEAGPAPGIFKFTRVGDTSQALVVNFTRSGTASPGDYLIWETRATFEPGANTARVAVLPVNDTVQEGDETVALTLTAGTGYGVGAPNSASVTIKDQFVAGRAGVFDPREVSATGKPLVDPDLTYLDAWIAGGQLNVQMDFAFLNRYGFQNLAIFLNTDRNPATGDYRSGRLAGQEYRVQVLAGLIPSYDLYRLRTAPPADPILEKSGDDIYVTSSTVTQSGNTVRLAIPLSLIGNPTAVDVFASTYSSGYGSLTTPGSGDRAPDYGALNTATRKVVVRKPDATQVVKLTDPAGDSNGEFDLVAVEYATIADQFSIKLTFNQPFDPSDPSLHYAGLSGEITLDSDRNLLTGAFFMGAQIPTWGGDVSLSYHVGSYWAPVASFLVITDTLGNWVGFGQGRNDGRWLAANKTLTLSSSLSIYDAFRRVIDPPGRTPTRISSEGRMFVQARTYGYDLFSTADTAPGSKAALNTTTGAAQSPDQWDASQMLSRTDPLDHGGLEGDDLIRVDAQVIADKLVIKTVLNSWINTDDDNLFLILLDTDLNAATGTRWANGENGGPAIGADFILGVAAFALGYGSPTVYVAELARFGGEQTRHEAMVLAEPAASFTQPGSFTVAIPLAELGLSNSPRLRFYVISARPEEGIIIDTAPPTPVTIGAAGTP